MKGNKTDQHSAHKIEERKCQEKQKPAQKRNNNNTNRKQRDGQQT